MIINTFFLMLVFLDRHDSHSLPVPTDPGYIFRVSADNTSALSWMRHASRSRDIPLVNLSYLMSSLTFHFNSTQPSRFDASHIKGSLNKVADSLSRPQDHPTYQTLFSSYPAMRSIPAYCPPRKLISAINACLSSSSMKEPSRQEIEGLFASRLSSLQLTAPGWESRTLASPHSRSPSENAS